MNSLYQSTPSGKLLSISFPRFAGCKDTHFPFPPPNFLQEKFSHLINSSPTSTPSLTASLPKRAQRYKPFYSKQYPSKTFLKKISFRPYDYPAKDPYRAPCQIIVGNSAHWLAFMRGILKSARQAIFLCHLPQKPLSGTRTNISL